MIDILTYKRKRNTICFRAVSIEFNTLKKSISFVEWKLGGFGHLHDLDKEATPPSLRLTGTGVTPL